MFDDIKSTWRPWPIVTTIFTLTFTAVTLSTVFFANLKNSMGCYSGDCSLIQRLTVAYQHGFDEISALIHLMVDIILMILLNFMVLS